MFRLALETYIKNPRDPSVVFNDDNVVIIKDKFPKSLRHYLVIPKSNKFTKQHPIDAFEDDEFYLLVKGYVEKAKQLLIEDLKKDGFKDLDGYVQAGVHSIPSMNNIHVHVMTKDFASKCMKHKKHYNSFTSRFFVNFVDLNPLGRDINKVKHSTKEDEEDEEDEEEDSSYSSDDSGNFKSQLIERDPKILENILKSSLICCHCGQGFGSSFVKLKDHLRLEFKEKFGRPPIH
ncbi:aprataxin-like protein [[Candida] jaroonii]|uniref:Aprataxin-like protein n=1 Tax=[Candida] jaroonii TaxID=467808 RepID=A0ACA9YAU8_9ASCO|nr:aprataxin-like protein [[Candida] jaroonii]